MCTTIFNRQYLCILPTAYLWVSYFFFFRINSKHLRNSVNQLIFVMRTRRVSTEVRTDFYKCHFVSSSFAYENRSTFVTLMYAEESLTHAPLSNYFPTQLQKSHNYSQKRNFGT